MAEFYLSDEANEDFINIADYGDLNFGINKSDAYRQTLENHLRELAKFPLHYQAVDHIRKGYRRSVCGAHTIYYRIDDDHITIIRILGRQDPFRALNE